MSRFPQPHAPSGMGLFGARGNGFLRRIAYTVPGSYDFDLPDDMPTDERGLIRVKGMVIGGGAAGLTHPTNPTAGGAGGGYSHKEFWVPQGSSFAIVVGAGGVAGGARQGGTSSITINGVTWQATGGLTTGGQGSGGDVNTNGGAAATFSTENAHIPGSSAGSPWANGTKPASMATGADNAGAKWLVPSFWDVEDFTDTALFKELTGIGAGGDYPTSGPRVGSFGGGGCGGFATSDGAGGLVIIYY